jgi:hypothetical protein
MSRNAAKWGLKHVIASVGAAIIMGGVATVPVVVLSIGGPAAATTASSVTASPGENNWG